MISRRFRNVAILLAILALVLAACGPQATPTPAPTEEPTATEEAVVEEATEEAVVEEATEEAVVEEATEEAVVEEATEVAVVEEATEVAVVEEATEEAVVEEATEAPVEATEVVAEVTEAPAEVTEVVAEATEVAPEATEAPITTEIFNDAGFTFSYPSNYPVEAGNGLYRLVNGDMVVVVVNHTAYTLVLGGVSFDDNAAALAFYLDRTGYTVGEATADGVAVSLPRRNEVGTANLVDLGSGNSAVVIALGPDADHQPTDVATQVKDTLSIPTILGAALNTEGLSTLATALVRGGFASTLNAEEGSYTVFAPSDDAFAAALEGMGMTADELLANHELLSSVLSYHVVEGVLKASDLTDGLELTTLNGEKLTVAIAEDGTVTINDVAGNSYGFVTTDVAASNGVIHVIDGVLSPVPAPEPEATPEVTPEATAEATQGS